MVNAAEELLQRLNGGRNKEPCVKAVKQDTLNGNTDALSESKDIHDFLSTIITEKKEVDKYVALLPDNLVELYNKHPEKRNYIEYFITQEIQDAKENTWNRTGSCFMRKDFLKFRTPIIWEKLEKSDISFENFTIYVKLLFALKKFHIFRWEAYGDTNVIYYGYLIPQDQWFFEPFKNINLETILAKSPRNKNTYEFFRYFFTFRQGYVLRHQVQHKPVSQKDIQQYKDNVIQKVQAINEEKSFSQEYIKVFLNLQDIFRWGSFQNSNFDKTKFTLENEEINYGLANHWKYNTFSFKFHNDTYKLSRYRNTSANSNSRYTYLVSINDWKREEITDFNQYTKMLKEMGIPSS